MGWGRRRCALPTQVAKLPEQLRYLRNYVRLYGSRYRTSILRMYTAIEPYLTDHRIDARLGCSLSTPFTETLARSGRQRGTVATPSRLGSSSCLWFAFCTSYRPSRWHRFPRQYIPKPAAVNQNPKPASNFQASFANRPTIPRCTAGMGHPRRHRDSLFVPGGLDVARQTRSPFLTRLPRQYASWSISSSSETASSTSASTLGRGGSTEFANWAATSCRTTGARLLPGRKET